MNYFPKQGLMSITVGMLLFMPPIEIMAARGGIWPSLCRFPLRERALRRLERVTVVVAAFHRGWLGIDASACIPSRFDG